MITAEIEPTIGGHFVFIERRPDMGDVRHIGEYLEIKRPEKLSFTMGVPQLDPRMTVVTISIQKESDGCLLTLVHEGVPKEYQDENPKGWKRILDSLLPAYDGIYAAGWR
jgi:uncharacterized protein YndB with AHSA1/START domain